MLENKGGFIFGLDGLSGAKSFKKVTMSPTRKDA